MPAVVKVRPNRGLGHFQSKRRSGSADSEINRYKYFVISLITKFWGLGLWDRALAAFYDENRAVKVSIQLYDFQRVFGHAVRKG